MAQVLHGARRTLNQHTDTIDGLTGQLAASQTDNERLGTQLQDLAADLHDVR